VHVAVTGASSGIGEAIARAFARAGHDVTLVARRKDVLERVAASLGGRTHVAAHDLVDPTRAADWIPEAEAALGPIDVLVSNAGFMTLGEVARFDPDEADRLVAINMLTPLRLIRAVVPGMIARKRGAIVNVTSIAAFVSMHGWAYQAASKAGSAMFSEALRSELAGTGVDVLTVYPGLTDTPMAQSGLDTYGGRGLAAMMPLGDAETLARRVVAAVKARRRRLVYPRYYALTGLFPRIARWFADRFAPRLRGDEAAPRPAASRTPAGA
jgi:short-subunit dehydrogenase